MKRMLMAALAVLVMACGAFGAPPAVDNDGGAENIANGVSALRGTLTDGSLADVYVCWGTADGDGSSTAAWQNVTFVGSLGQGAFSTNVAAYYGPKYYYRCYAVNVDGEAWASTTAEFFAKNPSVAVLPVTAGLQLWLDASKLTGLSDGQEMAQNVHSYKNLDGTAWQPLPWCGYGFVFQPYGDNWDSGSGRRVAHEAEVQQLLTPVWHNPNYLNSHQIPGIHEWAWSYLDGKWPGSTKRECYEMAKVYYTTEREKQVNAAHWKQKYPNLPKPPFLSMTGHGWVVHNAAEWGMDWIGIEIGENIVATQLHIAFLRGAARMFSLPTFADVSQWNNGTVPQFIAGVDESTAVPFELSRGGRPLHNGGLSSSVQARMWYVCWLSGITVVCPEACQDTFFAHTEEYRKTHGGGLGGYEKDTRVELSPYGVRAKKFYAITQKHPEIGIPYTPIGLLLDKYSGFFGFYVNPGHPWGVLKPTEGDREQFDFLNTVFPDTMRVGQTPENERLVANVCGDTFDVLITGASKDLLGMYPAVVVLGDHEFLPETVATLEDFLRGGGTLYLSRSHADQLGADFAKLQAAGKVELRDSSERADRIRLLERLRDTYVPVTVSGKMQYLINRTSTGWVVGLVNNEGARKDLMGPLVIDRTKDQRVTVKLRVGQVRSATEWHDEKNLAVNDNAVTLVVPAGEVRIVEFVSEEGIRVRARH